MFSAGTVFYVGAMVTYVAVQFQIYDLTKSNFAVGAMGLIQLVPLVLSGLYGGVLADRMDRRKIMVITGAAQVLLTIGLFINAAMDRPSVWAIYLLGALAIVAQSLQRPSREALLPRTVKHQELPAAVTLSALGSEVGLLLGPALGGLIIATAGVRWAYLVDIIGLGIATALYAAMRRYPTAVSEVEAGVLGAVRGIADGLKYAVRRPDLLGTYVVDLAAMWLAMPTVLFPAFASDVLEKPALLGLLYSIGTVGALLATATSGWTSRVHHHGRAVVISAAVWGLAIAVAGLAPAVWMVLLALLVAGAADMFSGVFRSVIWHQTIPDERRGRLAGIEMLSYSVGPLGGEARAGQVADATSVRVSIVSGGVLCVLGVTAVSGWLKGFWRYDSRTDKHAVRERELREARAEAELTT